MTIAEMMKLTKAKLDPWAHDNKGRAEIARDLVNFFDLLRIKPGGIRTVIVFHSEVKRGDFEETGMVDRTFWVATGRGRSLKLEPGDELVKESAGGPALFDLAEQSRDIIRGIAFQTEAEADQGVNSTEIYPDYKGMFTMAEDGLLLDAVRIEFTIGGQLPAGGEFEPGEA